MRQEVVSLRCTCGGIRMREVVRAAYNIIVRRANVIIVGSQGR